jgi:hypothetical protein
VDRREFLRTAVLAGAGLTIAPRALAGCSSDGSSESVATTAPSGPTTTAPARTLSGPFTAGNPYGPLRPADANGIRLPEGFTSRVVARSNERIAGTEYAWHFSPDGGACFADPNGSGDYVYVSNSETVADVDAGVSAIRFSLDGEVRDAYRILRGTNLNCAGGATPWGTWLSGEEYADGRIWECNPFEPSQGEARPALGRFSHEAAAVDPNGQQVYLTEDQPDGRLYRFTPSTYPDLTSGTLAVARVVGDPRAKAMVEWITVSDGTSGAQKPRPKGSTTFRGGEGICFHGGAVFFTTKGDNRVWKLDTAQQDLTILYDDDLVVDAPLRGVDNVTVSSGGEVFVAEDGDDLQLVVLGADGIVGPLLQVTDQTGSELAGPAFSPDGSRLYVSSQRARGGDPLHGLGDTYEIRGPFHS